VTKALSAGPAIMRDPGGVADRHFDVAIVGGGIYGALCAVEASRRGFRTLLIERADFGAGTSFNSLRTIHGGLRYLQWLDLVRARRSARQQRWWFERFPDLVQLRPCVMPLYGRRGRGRAAFRVAGAFAGLAGIQRFSAGKSAQSPVEILARGEIVRRWPGMPGDGLQGGAQWLEGFMPESSRVILECLRWAIAGGAAVLNYVELVEAQPAGNVRTGLTLLDRVTGEHFAVTAGAVVNAAGYRVDEVARRLGGNAQSLVRPTLAWNLLLEANLPEEACLVLTPPARDPQAYFLQPFHGRLLAGTGHAAIPQSGVASNPPRRIIESMQRQLDAAWPEARLARAQVLRVLAGILPGVRAGDARLATRPRIARDTAAGGARVVHVVGVKFTEAPEVARLALDRLCGAAALPAIARPPPGGDWNVLEPSRPATREALLGLAARESVVYLEDLVERRTNAWCDRAASERVARLVEGALDSRAPPADLPPATGNDA
jgi:glycerol-3-phosphate dehydrogenase